MAMVCNGMQRRVCLHPDHCLHPAFHRKEEQAHGSIVCCTHLEGAECWGVLMLSAMRSRSIDVHCCMSLVTPTALATPCAGGLAAPPPLPGPPPK